MATNPAPPVARCRGAAILLLIVAATPLPSQADTLQDRIGVETLRRNQGIDRDVARSRQSRENFRLEQQRFREADRPRGPELQMRLPVPRMERNCQTRVFGNQIVRSPCS